MSFAENFLRGFATGHQINLANQENERRQQERDIRTMLLKHELAKQKIDDAMAQYQAQYGAAEHQFQAQQGQPEASFRTQIPEAGAGAIPGAPALSSGSALESVPTSPKPVQYPDLPPELGGGGGFQRTPLTMEDMLRRQASAKFAEFMSTPQKLRPGETVSVGGQTIAENPKPAASEPLVPVEENGKGVYVPRSQAVGKPVYQKPPSLQLNGPAGQVDPDAIASSIMSGDQPPDTQGLYRYGAAVRTSLAKNGYNLTKAKEDWLSTQKYIATLNGQQQTRLRQAVDFTSHSLDVVEELANQWNAGKFPLLNKAKLSLAKNGALGPDAQKIATQLDAQISDLVSELGTVYKGGNSSTDESLKLAAKNLQSDWSRDQLLSAIGLTRKNLQIRQNSLKNTQMVKVDESPKPSGNDPLGIRK